MGVSNGAAVRTDDLCEPIPPRLSLSLLPFSLFLSFCVCLSLLLFHSPIVGYPSPLIRTVYSTNETRSSCALRLPNDSGRCKPSSWTVLFSSLRRHFGQKCNAVERHDDARETLLSRMQFIEISPSTYQTRAYQFVSPTTACKHLGGYLVTSSTPRCGRFRFCSC